ncbi:MAG: hypothetical protein SF053_00325 [Bacteroidia bacterium]|nr:hypothetical protein [Bacteroidia bacterium]
MLKNHVILTLLTLSGLSATGQFIDHFTSPDKQFEVMVRSKGVSDSNTEWVYFLVDHGGSDTLLLTTAITHDDPQPAVFWDQSSARLIFEDRRDRLHPIKVYDPTNKTTLFSTSGFIGRPMAHFFDASNDLLFFLRHDSNDWRIYTLLALDVQSYQITTIQSFHTSGDPYTGAPGIERLDTLQRTLTITFEDKAFRRNTTDLHY